LDSKRFEDMKTSYDNDLIDVLATEISNGVITVDESSDRHFSTLAATFPLSGARIDWSAVPGAIESVAVGDKELESFMGFFEMACEGLDDDEILTYVGDGLTNCAYSGPIGVLRRHLAEFMSIPQHHYFVGPECKWCMTFMFEGDMAFGHAPRA